MKDLLRQLKSKQEHCLRLVEDELASEGIGISITIDVFSDNLRTWDE